MSLGRRFGVRVLLALGTLGCQGGGNPASLPALGLEAVSGIYPVSERYLLVRDPGLHTILVRGEAASKGPVAVWADSTLLGVVTPRMTLVRNFPVAEGQTVALKILPGDRYDQRLAYSFGLAPWNAPLALEDFRMSGPCGGSGWKLDLGMGSYRLSVETAKESEGSLRIAGNLPFAASYPPGDGLPSQAFQVPFGKTMRVDLSWGTEFTKNCDYRLRLVRTGG
jgi:hypothetical protein